MSAIKHIYHYFRGALNSIPRFYYTSLTRIRVKSCGVGLTVNHKSDISGNVVIGDYCNNGMNINGWGGSNWKLFS